MDAPTVEEIRLTLPITIQTSMLLVGDQLRLFKQRMSVYPACLETWSESGRWLNGSVLVCHDFHDGFKCTQLSVFFITS